MAESVPDPHSPVEITVPPEGTVLGGKYRVEHELGRGGMGVVLLARHQVLGHRVALKILSGKASPVVLARFLREARATVELQSEHVCRVLDEGTSADGAPFLVMEYLEGDDLLRVLQKKGPLSVQEAADAVLQACDAMAEAHARGIVHRDLKPSNLFLCRRADGRSLIKVLDFGVSKLAPTMGDTELTETLAMLGSPMYMSPEQVTSAKTVDHRADVWALGVVLFRLLTKRSPFEAQGAMAVCAAILRDPPQKPREFRPELPVGLEAVIMRCLEKDPGKRFQTVLDLGRALVPFVPEGVTAARFRGAARLALGGDKPESTLTFSGSASPAVELGTYGAVTSNSAHVVRPRARWPWAVGFVALLSIVGLVVGLVVSKDAPKTGSTTSSASSSLDEPKTSAASAVTATAPAPTMQGAIEAAPPSVETTASVVATAVASSKPTASTKPISKPPLKPTNKPPVGKKPWGSAIDDPL